MQKYIPELLKEINDNPALLTQMRGDASLTLLFKHAFDPSAKFVLPEGDAPYKPDAAPIGMTPATLRQELKKLYVFCRTDLKPVRRESLFIQLLESIHPSEAEVLVAVKDQDLPRLYPNITHQLVFENGFVQVPPPEVTSKPKKVVKDQITDAVTAVKRGRGRPKKELGVTANP
jgi:hypothetical protein